MVVVDVSILQLLISMVLPVAVGIVVKQVAHPGVRAVSLAVLSAITAIAGAGLASDGVITQEVIFQAVFNLVVAVATYYGVWKPTGVTEAVNSATSDFGYTIKKDHSTSLPPQ